MRRPTRIAMFAVLALVVGAVLYFALRDVPRLGDFARLSTGPMQVTIEEEGVARVRDVYRLFPPVAGHLDRVGLDEGDAVTAGGTVIASLRPLEPPFLDERTRIEAEAAAEAALSAVRLAEAEAESARTALDLAVSELNRVSALAEKDFVSRSTLEKAGSDVNLKRAQLASALANVTLRQAQLASARARLRQPSERPANPDPGECCIQIRAPVSGVVLKILERSEQPVAPSTAIAEIGDPRDLEIAVDLLSTDALRIRPGSRADVTGYGGDEAFTATVRRIDPAAFTKISALGIEEQRVSVILDPDELPAGIGHQYRVTVSLIVWQADDVLQVPVPALFRAGGDWAVYRVNDGRAERVVVRLGRLNDTHAQVLEGLAKDDRVILYPSDTLEDGSPVEQRP